MATSSSTSTSTATASYSSGRLGSASPSTSVICQEIFDESCQPSSEEINDYALLLGIDPVKEAHLLYLAKEGLMQALPPDWKICYSEEKCGHYYYNIKTKQSQWDHPLDAVYREFVEQARHKQTTSVAATPNTVDNSDDASQLDSGIRSLQGTDYDCDNTNNTNDMSSPVGGSNTNTNMTLGAITTPRNKSPIVAGMASTSNSSAPNSTTTSTSGFSGGVSRFLESRSKNFGGAFQPVKNTRFEVAKTSPHISLVLAKFGGGTGDSFAQKKTNKPLTDASGSGSDVVDGGTERKGGFTLSGTGAMFLKSRRQIEAGLSQATAMMTSSVHNAGGGVGVFGEGTAVPATPPGVKGILRDSSLTDMRRRLERDEHQHDIAASSGGSGGAAASGGGGVAEDKKSVRFNLDETRMRGSPEEDPSSSRRLTQSPEVSINSDDDADPDDDPWDEDDEDDVVGHFNPDGSFQRSLNPFLMDDEKHVKEIKVIPVPKAQTIKMLQAQSFSMDLPERDRAKLSELARSQSIDAQSAATATGNLSAVSYLDKLKDTNVVKPLYEDTDSESKGSSVRSFIINKSEEHDSLSATVPSNNPFDLDELNRRHSRDVEQLEKKLQSNSVTTNAAANEKPGLRTLKVASKLVGFLKKDTEKALDAVVGREVDKDSEELRQKMEKEQQSLLKEERERLEDELQHEIDVIKKEHEQKLKNIRHEYDLRLISHQHQLEEAMDLRLDEYRTQLEEDLDVKRRAVVDEHKAHMATLQKNHSEILQDLERDLKSEEELVKKEHATKLNEMRDKLTHELEVERQRMRETGEDRLYEKVRCEKRLLEDKYRCLKEKYVRLKTDVKLSLERRNRRREAQAMHQQQSLHTTTTGSETERSLSNKPSIGNSENRSLTLSTSCQDRGNGGGLSSTSTTMPPGKGAKPPLPPKLHLTVNKDHHRQQQQQQHVRDRSAERGQSQSGVRKPGIASKYIKHLQVQDDTTSISQSDTTISNNYTKGRYLPAPVLSDNGNSDSEAFQCNQENNNNQRLGSQRKKLFSRTKSASTSRLNSDNYKGDRPCTPVENLRHQLQKLEDLEDQFPENTLDTTYHLRYPFSDISNDRAGTTAGTSSELEFFKHRIHLERDSVRRAKESLRTQRTNFRARQREIKQRHKASVTRHTLDQLIQEEKELTEMEVNLHRTRALLGEKVIRLRHLEQSLLRIYEKEKPAMDLLGVEQKDDATLSDLSSHSSSGFSSTDFASGCCVDTQNLNKRKEAYHQESTECIQSLEILNAEIREILDILGKNQQVQHGGISVPMISPSELNWTHMLSTGANIPGTSPAHVGGASLVQQQTQHSLAAAATASVSLMQHHAPQSIPTLADRLETYRQLASGRMQTSLLAANTIVSQSPRAVNYTTSLVERTRDLRNWLRQAKTEHDMLAGMSATMAQQHGINSGSVSLASVLSATSGNNVATAGAIGAGSATQTNL